MTLSLNEVEAMAKKATRGAGYPWGLAEEAARATRWLCAHGVDGCAALADLLSAADGADLKTWRPSIHENWIAPGGRLCPIASGAALADGLGDLGKGDLVMDNVVSPLLLLPFAAARADGEKSVVSLAWTGGEGRTDGVDLSLSGDAPKPVDQVHVILGGVLQTPMARATRSAPDHDTKTCLDRLAHRTYAPATEESRLKGAGAGLSDND